MPLSAHPLSHHYNCSQKWKFYTSFPPNFFNFLMVFHSLKSNEHDRGRAFLKINMLIHPQTFQDPSPFFTPFTSLHPFSTNGMALLSLFSIQFSKLNFIVSSATLLSSWDKDLCKSLGWVVNAQRHVRNSIPKSWHCCWKWQGRPANPTMRSSKYVIMQCVGRGIWISKRHHAPPLQRLGYFYCKALLPSIFLFLSVLPCFIPRNTWIEEESKK